VESPEVGAAEPGRYELPAELEARLISPALIVYLDAVRHNLARVIELVGGDPARWRPHLKTSKIPCVFREIVASGVRAFKCATTREATTLLDVLRGERVDDADLLVAYPLVGPALERLGAIAAEYPGTRLSVLCEDPDDVAVIPPAIGIFVDVNPGMNRTGIPMANPDRVVAVARRAGARFRGVHHYDGQLHAVEPAERTSAAFAGFEKLMAVVDQIERAGPAVGEIITSGTPTFSAALEYAPFVERASTVHRVSPGTVVLHDARSERENLGLRPAALLFCRVVSHPTDDIVTCDAGSKSIAAEAGDPCATVLGRPDLEALRPSEEHLPLRQHGDGPRPARGDSLLLIPRHVCPTVNLADEAVIIDGGRFAGVVPVTARGHEAQTLTAG